MKPLKRMRTVHVTRSLLALVTVAGVFAVVQRPPSELSGPRTTAVSALSALPLSFLPDDGTSVDGALFHVRDAGGAISFARGAVTLALRAEAQGKAAPTVRMVFEGAAAANLMGVDRLPGVVNYLGGADASQWRTQLPTFGAVQYDALYEGISLRYDGETRQLKGTYELTAGANPAQIRWRHEGASSVRVDEAGDLVIAVAADPARTIVERAPVAWQDVNGVRQPVDVRYTVDATGGVGFAVGAYDRARPLTIDPVITYGTYVATGNADDAADVAVDAAGNMYVTGTEDTVNRSRAFVRKINAAGTAYVYQTFFSGNDDVEAFGLAVDDAGNAYVAGVSLVSGLPTPNGFQPNCVSAGFFGCEDAYVAKLNDVGLTTYGTYYGRSGIDSAEGISVDSTGHAYVTGMTTPNGSFVGDAYVIKIDTTASGASSLVYERLLGGNGMDGGEDVVMDAVGNAYVTGFTQSTNFATVNAFQAAPGGLGDAFVAKLDAAGAVVYSTYLGGSGTDNGYGIAVDAAGGVAVTGDTQSSNFPTASALQATYGGAADAFVARLGATGQSLEYGSYLGGSGKDQGNDIALNGTGCAWVTGQTFSSDFPLQDALGTRQGTSDAFLTQICPATASYAFSTVMGGSGDDSGDGLVLDASGNLLVSGTTTSSNFPVTAGAVQTSYLGGPAGSGGFSVPPTDGFVVKIEVATAGSGENGGTGGGSSGGSGGDESAPNLTDTDSDGLPDVWETLVGLDPNDANGPNGADGDPDNDGYTNKQEFDNGTHPKGQAGCLRFLAEGVVNGFFETRLSLFNPDTKAARVVLRFLKTDGTVKVHIVEIGPVGRVTIDARAVLGGDATFSVVAESDCNELVLDRLVQWSGHAGSHAESSVAAGAKAWYLAEGATHGGLHTFYLLQNPHLTLNANVHVKFLLPGGHTFEKDFVVGPNSRKNIWLNEDVKEIGATDVSAVITSDLDIVAERAMYLGTQGAFFKAGHESAAVTARHKKWLFAEGATGPFFDTFLLIANPDAQDATVTVKYLLPNGSTVTKVHTVKGNSRHTVWVDYDDGALADTAVSIEVEANIDVICERSMWWGGAAGWTEAHNAFGSPGTAAKWALAEGEIGGSADAETYVLVANTATVDAVVKVTVALEGGQKIEKTLPVLKTSRYNIVMKSLLAELGIVGSNKKFSVIVEWVGAPPASGGLVVERAMYFGNFVSGSDALATALSALHP